MVGYLQCKAELDGETINIEIELVPVVGRVTEIFEIRKDLGKNNFPCFIVDKDVDHGFSGGPVFCDHKLCGIASSGAIDKIDGGTIVASMWPVSLLACDYGKDGKLAVGPLLDSGTIRASDWLSVGRRISIDMDDRERKYAFLKDFD